MEIPLPWERLLWRGRPALPFLTREHYLLTDLRLVRVSGAIVADLLLQDIGDVVSHESRADTILGTSTLVVEPRDPRRRGLVLRHVRRGPQLAALLDLLSADPTTSLDAGAVDAAMAWSPHRVKGLGEGLAAVAIVILAVFGIVAGLHGKGPPPVTFAPDDAIYPGGVKRDRDEIVRFMEEEVLPWARATLGPLKGGGDRVTCETCHGEHPAGRDWQMPAVAALPQTDVRDRGWEQYGGPMDTQIRNAVYGYLAESDKQAKAAYMREFVLPGMAARLRRPAYDFTRPYEYNRSRLAFGCYHCHRVK